MQLLEAAGLCQRFEGLLWSYFEDQVSAAIKKYQMPKAQGWDPIQDPIGLSERAVEEILLAAVKDQPIHMVG